MGQKFSSLICREIDGTNNGSQWGICLCTFGKEQPPKELRLGMVYSIPCDCGAMYIDETEEI